MLKSALKIATLPFHACTMALGGKSFVNNPIIGSPYLNGLGLHVKRIKLAEKMAMSRKARLRHMLPDAYVDALDQDGYVVVENALPDAVFEQLSNEVENSKLAAREMKQGATVTRFIDLPPTSLSSMGALNDFVRGDLFQGLLRYTASFDHEPIINIHTVLTDPEQNATDPQTVCHSDAFYPTAKGWLFLRDVEIEDGPFGYVPGSHRLTEGRLEWEYQKSLSARNHRNRLHALGSFRASAGDIEAMGFEPLKPLPVAANTLVMADTHGFHARCVASRPSTRLAIYGSLRSNPFVPFTGLDVFSLPGLKGRKAEILTAARTVHSKITGKPEGQPLVGVLRPGDPAVR